VRDTGLFQNCAVLKLNIRGFELAARRIDEDYRCWNFRFGYLVSDFPRFRDVMQNDTKTEFFLQPEDGEDVIVTVRVPVDNAFSVKHFDKGFHCQIASR
jgi:hypothetical protein